MSSQADHKKYWDVFETIRWISTRDEEEVAAMRDMCEETKIAVALIGMRVPLTLRGLLGRPVTDSEVDRKAGNILDELFGKVQSGRVPMTAIRRGGGSGGQIQVPFAELNDLEFRLVTGDQVATAGLWSRRRNILAWESPQFLRVDATCIWPARKTKTVAVCGAILAHLREIMTPEARLTKSEAKRRCIAEVRNAYPQAFDNAWAALDSSCKRGRGKHGPRASID